MNAAASGMPAKLAATPEKVVSTERTIFGVPSRIAAYAIRKPSSPPRRAVTRLSSMLCRYACRRFPVWTISVTLSSVKPPVAPWNAPTRTVAEGRMRNTRT